MVVDENNQTMFAVDPAESDKVLAVLREEETAKRREFLGILTTHKHPYESGWRRDVGWRRGLTPPT